MNTENALKTAHIHFESATFRIHVPNVDGVDLQKLDDNKPDFVISVGKSHDFFQNKSSLLVDVVDGYDVDLIADWFEKYLK